MQCTDGEEGNNVKTAVKIEEVWDSVREHEKPQELHTDIFQGYPFITARTHRC